MQRLPLLLTYVFLGITCQLSCLNTEKSNWVANSRIATAGIDTLGPVFQSDQISMGSPMSRQYRRKIQRQIQKLTRRAAKRRTRHSSGNRGLEYGTLEPKQLLAAVVGAESGKLDNLHDQWTTVNLSQQYADPVVVAGPSSYVGTNTVSLRIRNVDSDSFEIRIDEWDYQDEAHGAPESVDYLVMEAGTHTLDDGTVVTAGKESIPTWFTTVDTGVNGIVLTSVTSENDSATVTTRVRNVGSTFEAKIQEEEAADGVHEAEEVSWIQFQVGTGTSDEIQFVASETPQSVHSLDFAIDFGQSFGSEPVFLATMQTADGYDPATVRTKSVGDSGSVIFLEEETSSDAETYHLSESVGYLAMTPGILENTDNVSIEVGESGTVSITDQWTTVTLNGTYDDLVVVAGPASRNDASPTTIQICNVTENSFDIRVNEWDYLDGVHPVESVDYLVMESGTYELPNGTVFTAGTEEIGTSFQVVNPGGNGGIVFTSVTSENDPAAVTTRVRNVGSTFEVQLQEEEAADGIHVAETVSWIQIQAGSGSLGGLNYAVDKTPQTVNHADYSIGFGGAFDAEPVFLATMQTRWGWDVATLRSKSVSESGAVIFVEEEQSRDAEIGHWVENVGYLAIEPGIIEILRPAPVDSNETPTDITPNSFNVNENIDTTAGYSVGTLTSTDPDSGDTFTYSVVGGADQAKFTVSGNQLVLTDGTLNFENQSSYSVTVRTTDAGGLWYEETLTINVVDLNETPTDIAPNSFNVNENIDTTAGYSVGTLTSTDPDGGDTFTYSVVGGADQAKFTVSGNQLVLTDGTLNFENQSSYSVTVRTTDSGGLWYEETLTINVNDLNAALPILPQAFVDTTYAAPMGGQTWTVNQGDDLQAVLDAAAAGDTIVLQAGATFTGNFLLPDKTDTPEGGDWIYIVSSELDQLPEGERVGPADAVHMPKIVSPNQNPALWTDFGSDHYRIAGIEISTDELNFNLVLMGWGLENETDPWWERTRADSVDEQPHHITFDRTFIHSTSDINGARTGILADGRHIGVVDSYISNFKDRSDSQAIVVWSGQGPYKIANNFLEAAGENIMFGGESIPIANLVPSDIEIHGNHFYKRLEWKVDLDQWVVKNLFELKAAQRIHISGNVFENSWADDQAGFGILFTPRDHGYYAGVDNPWVVVQDVTFENNIVRHVGQGMLISAEDELHPTQQTKRILISNNVIEDVNEDYYGSTKFLSFNTHDRPVLDVTVRNNLFLHTDGQLGNSAVNFQHSGINIDGFVFENNILTHGLYGLFSYGDASWDESLANYTIKNNGFIFNAGPEDDYYQANFATLNPDNLKADTLDEVGFVDYENGDYHLEEWSPFKNAGTDGKDLGPDWDVLLEATDGVIDP